MKPKPIVVMHSLTLPIAKLQSRCGRATLELFGDDTVTLILRQSGEPLFAFDCTAEDLHDRISEVLL